MSLKVLHTFLCYIVVYVIAFEDIIYVYGQVSEEMVEQGRRQYQLLQERSNLPHYGNCWRSAVEHIEEGCRNLSEETQSDMALHLTNCFLEMSGHDTYNCELDKKPNLKGICIRSMTDRAFNVYTEFYTHTQNMCWFLRGQVWYETIAENTLRVGKQLELSAKNQKRIIESQKESLDLQEKLLHYGKNLEKIMEDFYVSTKQHQEVLLVMSSSLRSLQSWLIGELSWFDLTVFYVAAAILIIIATSSHRTAAARLPILVLLIINAIVERSICAVVISQNEMEAHLLQSEIHRYVWWSRKIFIALSVGVLVYKTYHYRDIMRINNLLLQKISYQNLAIIEKLEKTQGNFHVSNGYVVDENSFKKSHNSFSLDVGLNGSCRSNNYLKENAKLEVKTHRRAVLTNGDIDIIKNGFSSYKTDELKTPKNSVQENAPFNKSITGRQRISPFSIGKCYVDLSNSNGKYNLRSRHGTPSGSSTPNV